MHGGTKWLYLGLIIKTIPFARSEPAFAFTECGLPCLTQAIDFSSCGITKGVDNAILGEITIRCLCEDENTREQGRNCLPAHCAPRDAVMLERVVTSVCDSLSQDYLHSRELLSLDSADRDGLSVNSDINPTDKNKIAVPPSSAVEEIHNDKLAAISNQQHLTHEQAEIKVMAMKLIRENRLIVPTSRIYRRRLQDWGLEYTLTVTCWMICIVGGFMASIESGRWV